MERLAGLLRIGPIAVPAGAVKKALAQEFHDRIKSELWRIVKLGQKPRRTWNEAAVKWLRSSRTR